MAAASTSIAADPVRQFSVFMENRAGRLHDLSALLGHNEVHVMAITVLDTTDNAIVRLVVDDPDKARAILAREDFPYHEADILAVEIADESDLKVVLAALLEAEVDTHYVYSFIKRPAGKSALALQVDDVEIAAQALNNRGFKVLSQRDIAR
ncbi:MAG TPA: acetolactate synthase [Opitutaceae bacterium]|nr:acetolactate synthase [Opitutaceae bacterium]